MYVILFKQDNIIRLKNKNLFGNYLKRWKVYKKLLFSTCKDLIGKVPNLLETGLKK